MATAPLSAQIPYGRHVASFYLTSATSTAPDGLMIVDPVSGNCQVVNGLAAMTGSPDVKAVQIDPVNENVWIGGHRASAGQLSRLLIDGAGNVLVSLNWGQMAASSTINGIAFDRNGDPLVASDGGVYRFPRGQRGAAATLVGAASSPTMPVTSVCTDPTGNIFFGQNNGDIYRMAVRPDCTYAPPVLVTNVRGAAGTGPVSGVDYCPGAPASLGFTVDGGTGGVGLFTLPSGPAASSSPPGNFYHSLEYDPDDDVFFTTTHTAVPEQVHIVTKALATTTACTFPPGGIWTTGVDTVDTLPGQLTVLPRCPPRGQPFSLEAMLQCEPGPGNAGGIFLLAPATLTLVVGPVPSSGKVGFSAPNVSLPPGFPPGVLLFAGACLDGTTGQLTISNVVTWPEF